MKEKRKTTPVLSIVKNKPSKEVMETLAYLIQEAAAGNLLSFAYVAKLPQKKYVMDTVGETAIDALGELGMVHMLADSLKRRLLSADE